MIPHSRPTLSSSEKKAVARVLHSCHLTAGKEVSAFEEEFADWLGGGYALATQSGLAALHLALLTMPAARSSLWIPDYACAALITAADYVGALYRLLDCRRNSFLADSSRDDGRSLRLGVHLFGETDISLLNRSSETLIEDAAQAPGAWLGDGLAGTFGYCSIFSFYATKVLCTGSGGMLFSRDPDLITEARDLADYDNRDDYQPRYAYRMNEIQAAMGRVQLSRLDELIQRRLKLAELYHDALSDLLSPEELPLHPRESVAQGRPTHVYARFCLRLPGRAKAVLQRLRKAGIEAKRPVYQPAHRLLRQNPDDFPNSEAAHQAIVSLPFYPSLANAEVDKVLTETRKALHSSSLEEVVNGPAG